MKNKKVIILSILLIVTILIISSVLIMKNKKNNKSDEIPDGYIAVFHGGVGEQTYETYIYKIDNEKPNYGFKYINTKTTTTSWGSSEWTTKITKRGKVDWTDDVFGIAKENNAYSYVTLPNSDKDYTIEEYQEMFIMN